MFKTQNILGRYTIATCTTSQSFCSGNVNTYSHKFRTKTVKCFKLGTIVIKRSTDPFRPKPNRLGNMF